MSVVLNRIVKHYGPQLIVDDVSLEISQGEFFVLLGPSGSGKSTILRIISGLVLPDGGQVLLHGNEVTFAPPQQRNIGFVFQDYALFRHMSVQRNIEFGLKMRKTAPPVSKKRCEELLELVGMTGLGDRYPDELSGGQQQRVALARALAYEPSVLLLDEPLGALDPQIRSQLRRRLRDIQRKLGITTLLVTHDQEEAMELADRLGVLDRGRLLEVGDSTRLYDRPRSSFVATFLGTGTVLVGRARQDEARFGPLSLPIPPEVAHEDGSRVQLLIRPEQVTLSEVQPSKESIILGKGTVIEQSFAGAFQRVRVRIPRLSPARQIAPVTEFGEEEWLVEAVVPAGQTFAGKQVWVILKDWHILEQPPLRLLVFDRGEGSPRALVLARELRGGLNAAVTLLGIAPSEKQAKVLREAILKRRAEAGLGNAELRMRQGEVVEEILGEQLKGVHDTVVLRAGSLGSLSHEESRIPDRSRLAALLKGAAAPVLIVKKAAPAILRILICTAAGEPGKQGVRVGGFLARRLGATVTLLHVTREAGVSPVEKAHLADAMATLRALDIGCEMRIRTSATAAAEILAEAREGSHDLIVIGSGPRGRSFFIQPGDPMSYVVTQSDRHVLVIPDTRA